MKCNARYYGEGSVYHVGNKAHGPDCAYSQRGREDRRHKRRKKEPKVTNEVEESEEDDEGIEDDDAGPSQQ